MLARWILLQKYPGILAVLMVPRNLDYLFGQGALAAILRIGIVFGGLVLALPALRSREPGVRAATAVGALYLVALLFVGLLNEERIFYESYALLVPGMCWGLARETEREGETETTA